MRYGKTALGVRVLLACGTLFMLGAAEAGAHAMSFAVTSISAPESAGTVAITVNRTGSGTSPWVDYTTEAGTASAGLDYTETSGRITFGPNEQQRTFSVPILDDPALEADETVTLRLTAAGPAGDGHLGTQTVATLTILDDDSFSNFSLAGYTVNENAGTATVEILRTGHLGATDSVHYATSAGTATAGADYTDVSGTATFAPNEVSKTFDVPILDDTVADEAQESVNLTLSLPSAPNHHIGSLGTSVLYISDDEAPTDPTIPTVTSVTRPDAVAAPPAPPSSKGDPAPVVFATSAQAALRRGGVGLTASCAAACSVTATGHVSIAGHRFALRRMRMHIGAGHRAALRLALSRAARAAVRRALASGRPAMARITVVSRDGTGARRATTRTIRLTA